jgi:renalase
MRTPSTPSSTRPSSKRSSTRVARPTQPSVAIIGAGMAGITAARTLAQAGWQVSVFEKSRGVSGRMSTRQSDFGSFDHGAQYFTVRDERFRHLMHWALASSPEIARPWAANAVRVLDAQGRTLEAALPVREPHWVSQPGMNTLVQHLAQPLIDARRVHLNTQVSHLSIDTQGRWTLSSHNPQNIHMDEAQHAGFDAALLAIPHVQALALLQASERRAMLLNQEQNHEVLSRGLAQFSPQLQAVTVAPCWTLMLAFPHAAPLSPQAPARALGPQWNAARSTHHRIAWLARESSKPMRSGVERWTVQASAAWSQEHLEDDAERVQAKLLKAFAEVTGIRAEPAHAQVHRWRYAKTEQALGASHLWDAQLRIGLCGDWCLGHRVEDAFVSGLELALSVIE